MSHLNSKIMYYFVDCEFDLNLNSDNCVSHDRP